jgi:MFS family permease
MREVRSSVARRSLGRPFGWLWTAYAVSAYGSGLGFGAFPLIAVLVLHASPAQVSGLSAVGPAVGALIALPLGPWVEFRRKRPVMITMDLVRFAVMITIPVAYALGRLSFVQLLVVSAVVAAAKIAFNAASGAYLRALVRPDDLLVANARFESTNWSSIAVGPPLGGAAIGLFGPVITVVADAVSYLISALGITAIGGREEHPQRTGKGRVRASELLDGWRHILTHPGLRALYLNNMLVGGLIMATEPLLAVLLLRQLGFPPWQYGLAFAAPCAGGFLGSRLARRVVTRYGQHRVFRTVGTLRAVWLIGLAFVRPGVTGLATVIAVELAIIISMSMYNPVLATYRLEHTPEDRIARTLSAWSIGQQASIAVFTALAGLLADITSPRTALTVAGLLILTSPLLLPRRHGIVGARVRDDTGARQADRGGGGERCGLGAGRSGRDHSRFRASAPRRVPGQTSRCTVHRRSRPA